jgi:CRP-like cAMP-binding protein
MMVRPSIDPLLRDLHPFSECNARERRLLAPVVSITNVDTGDVLTRQGEPGDNLMVVVDGTATVVRDGDVIAEVSRGDVGGSLLWTRHAPPPSPSSAMTLAPSLGLVLARVPWCPTVAIAVLRTTISRLPPAADEPSIRVSGSPVRLRSGV